MKISEVLHFRKFDPHASRPAQLTYLLFGESGDLWLAHLTSSKPDFDQIASVAARVLPPAGSAEQIRIPDAAATQPLGDGQSYLGQREGGSITLQGVRTKYLEFGDLAE